MLATDRESARGLERHARRIAATHQTILVRRRPGGPSASLDHADAARLGRHLARTKLGLALGAGGAWGFAHLGALQVLEEAGFAVDAVAGTSVGALVGGLLAMGLNLTRIYDEMRRMFSPEAAHDVFRISLAGTSSGRERLLERLRQLCGGRRLEQLPLPLAVAVIDLDARRARAVRRGLLWQALAAATALPGLYPPWEQGGRRQVDAVALHPVPTEFLAGTGFDVIVAVDLIGGGSSARRAAEPHARGAAARFLGALTEVLDIAAFEASRRHAARADIVIRPVFPTSCWRDVELAEQFLAAGRDAARSQLPALRALVSPNQQQTGEQHG